MKIQKIAAVLICASTLTACPTPSNLIPGEGDLPFPGGTHNGTNPPTFYTHDFSIEWSGTDLELLSHLTISYPGEVVLVPSSMPVLSLEAELNIEASDHEQLATQYISDLRKNIVNGPQAGIVFPKRNCQETSDSSGISNITGVCLGTLTIRVPALFLGSLEISWMDSLNIDSIVSGGQNVGLTLHAPASGEINISNISADTAIDGGGAALNVKASLHGNFSANMTGFGKMVLSQIQGSIHVSALNPEALLSLDGTTEKLPFDRP